ncbi:small integral membrane protein 4 [Uranotaenia lowii]|uniref:small integral membrane protein 4 n=1 Tax=Uranotaenia lowii TaxID=190385 RepID=UPI0024796C6F|nr:small integral membrane protein 4 [Uranotaenia lowii]
MRIRRSRTLKQLLDLWPGKNTLGIYRFLPLFFGLGAALEFSMIHWRVGETNFYNTFKKRQAKEIVDEKLRLHQLEPSQQSTS